MSWNNPYIKEGYFQNRCLWGEGSVVGVKNFKIAENSETLFIKTWQYWKWVAESFSPNVCW